MSPHGRHSGKRQSRSRPDEFRVSPSTSRRSQSRFSYDIGAVTPASPPWQRDRHDSAERSLSYHVDDIDQFVPSDNESQESTRCLGFGLDTLPNPLSSRSRRVKVSFHACLTLLRTSRRLSPNSFRPTRSFCHLCEQTSGLVSQVLH